MTRYHWSWRNLALVSIGGAVVFMFGYAHDAPWWVLTLLSTVNGVATGLVFPIRRRIND